MKRKVILIATLCGAIAGALLTRLDFRLPEIAAFARDQELLKHRAILLACAAGWVLFSLYWDYAARNAAAARSSEAKFSRAIHVFLTNAALLLEIAPIRGFGRFLPVLPAVMMAGLAVEAFGLGIAIWARRHLGRNWSGEITVKVDHQLVRSGPYGRLRHPIYTGILTMYLGTVLVTGEWLAVGGLALIVFAYWRKIRLEEATLRAAFGAEYDAYRRDTWALVPGLH